MSTKHPIISVYGSSGSGRGTVRDAFEKVFRHEEVNGVFVDGAGFHRFDREAYKVALAEALQAGDQHFSHFGPAANLFTELQDFFKSYGATGTGKRRRYIHTAEDAVGTEAAAGEFTDWEDLPDDSDVLVYEGLHGAVKTADVNLPEHVDLRIGVAPIINLEWIRKLHDDTGRRGYTEEQVMDTILRRMHDYVHYLIPQFVSSDINFQMLATVDTSDPIVSRDIPAEHESMVVIRFRRPEDFDVDFPYLLRELHGSWMSRRNSIVVPGGKMGLAMELILRPIVRRLMDAKRMAS